jgi:hypothetical protein
MANRRVCTQAKALHGGVKLPDDRDDERRNSPEALRVDFKGLIAGGGFGECRTSKTIALLRAQTRRVLR